MNKLLRSAQAGCLGLAISWSAAEPPSSLPERVMAADYSVAKGPRSKGWRECLGVGRAAEGLRADWQEQLRLVQKGIGFKAIRLALGQKSRSSQTGSAASQALEQAANSNPQTISK